MLYPFCIHTDCTKNVVGEFVNNNLLFCCNRWIFDRNTDRRIKKMGKQQVALLNCSAKNNVFGGNFRMGRTQTQREWKIDRDRETHSAKQYTARIKKNNQSHKINGRIKIGRRKTEKRQQSNEIFFFCFKNKHACFHCKESANLHRFNRTLEQMISTESTFSKKVIVDPYGRYFRCLASTAVLRYTHRSTRRIKRLYQYKCTRDIVQAAVPHRTETQYNHTRPPVSFVSSALYSVQHANSASQMWS